ncbi:M20 family metallopeptidase [Virgibacillus xinjiangensis]|uniref:M20 family metallopeptidase n=1 Tax=Virgibacillus xinjiangensis TaxID=393090 RepID=A0ABV7CUR8_9BACI
MRDIYHAIKQDEDMMVDYLKEIIEKESPSLDKELVDQVADWVARTFEQLTGGQSTVIENALYGNHVRAEWGEGEEQILVLAHMDTVWPRDTIKKMPFTIQDGIAYGPGVFDMKGGLIQGLFAVKALKDLGIKLQKKVVFLFDADEEIGNPSSKKMIEEEAKKSELVFVLEPGMSEKGSLKTTRKGLGVFHIEVTGKPSHAGMDPAKGVSAIEELAHQTLYLHSQSNLKTGTTFNVGKIEGGSASNVIAEKARAEVDLRVESEEEMNRALPLIRQLKPKLDGVKIQVEGGINRPPLERTDQVADLFATAKQLADEYLGFELTEMASGGASDGNYTAPHAPTLDGLGPVGDGAHANHEQVVLSQMPVRSALFAMLLAECGGKKS